MRWGICGDLLKKLSFRRKPESSLFKQLQSISTQVSARVKNFYECI